MPVADLTTRNTADLLVSCFLEQGVDAVFGNPGTTELPLMEALASRQDPPYYLGLQEIVSMGMADGYAQAVNRPAVVNLHAGPGLGNAMGNLFNASRSRTPLVVTAGQQDTRFHLEEPLLHADLVGMVSQYVKWAYEVRRPEEIPAAVRRAFKEAMTVPTGPTFLSLPMDVLLAPSAADPLPAAPIYTAPAPDGAAIADLLKMLDRAEAPVIVAGDRVDRSGGRASLVELAAQIGAAVWAEPFAQRLPCPPDHRLFAGFLPPFGPLVKDALTGHDLVLVIGAEAFLLYPPFAPGSPFPDGSIVVHIDESSAEMAKAHRLDLGIVCDVAVGLETLLEYIPKDPSSRHMTTAGELDQRRSSDRERLDASIRDRPQHPASVLGALGPFFEGRVVVDEAVSSTAALHRAFVFHPPAARHGLRGGGLGWGLPAALGVALGHPDRDVVAVLGDGSAMYAIQGLWTAAHHRLKVFFVILDNEGYEIIKAGLRRQGGPAGLSERYVGMDIASPTVSWGHMAAAMGVPYAEATGAADVLEVAEALAAGGGPALLRVPIRGKARLP